MYEVTEKDLIEDLEGFPIEVVQLMLKRQKEQTGKVCISVFQKDRYSSDNNGGFDWEITMEGFSFWVRVLKNRDFDTFFKLYPKYIFKALNHNSSNQSSPIVLGKHKKLILNFNL